MGSSGHPGPPPAVRQVPAEGSAPIQHRFSLNGERLAHIRFTAARDGDLRVAGPPASLAATRRRIVDLPWTWLRQVHGSTVLVVDEPGQHAGVRADAVVTAAPGSVLAIHTADCAPVALVGSSGVVGAVHAGWRGLAAGVVEAAVARLQERDGTEVRAVVGPCIHPECYAFGAAELARLINLYGPEIQGATSDGAPALDLPATVTAALRRTGVVDVDHVPVCTGCDRRFFSHRARGDTGRQAMLVWMEG